MTHFPTEISTANPVFYRTYSRVNDKTPETWNEVCLRTTKGLTEIGNLSEAETSLILEMQIKLKAITSGRFLWVGGTEWLNDAINCPGAFNCSGTNLTDWEAFGLVMDLAMMGCGTGVVVEEKYINLLPVIKNHLNVTISTEIGVYPKSDRQEKTSFHLSEDTLTIVVGDSRGGWVHSYLRLLEASSDIYPIKNVVVDLGNVRSAGEPLKGFGGIANPGKLSDLYFRCANILNQAVGRKLTSVECCLLTGEAALTVVAGNIRRSAMIQQGDSGDKEFANAKENLWQESSEGNWRIDPDRNALRMANQTRIFHHKPSREECLESVRKQFYTGEGAIQWAGEAIARANNDLFKDVFDKPFFLQFYSSNRIEEWFKIKYPTMPKTEVNHRLSRYSLNPCAEIFGSNFFCNLSDVHLNRLDPLDLGEQSKAFEAASISAASLLNYRFTTPRYAQSHELDPIIGVSITGLFDFFVNLLGLDWLEWWKDGREKGWQIVKLGEYFSLFGKLKLLNFIDESDDNIRIPLSDVFSFIESKLLVRWREIVNRKVQSYCEEHSLRKPNRYTTIQPSGTKSLLTGASPGWHPPKAQQYIRRITFSKGHPVALACLDYGYSIVPGQSDTDDSGDLLTNPFDEKCTEWLVEIPVEVSWAKLAGVEKINIEEFSALAQLDFYMKVQNMYTTHNTSATIELMQSEIECVADRIYRAIQSDEGYISVAMLPRHNVPFPRLPFEKIDRQTFLSLSDSVRQRQKEPDFHQSYARHRSEIFTPELAPVECGTSGCVL